MSVQAESRNRVRQENGYFKMVEQRPDPTGILDRACVLKFQAMIRELDGRFGITGPEKVARAMRISEQMAEALLEREKRKKEKKR